MHNLCNPLGREFATTIFFSLFNSNNFVGFSLSRTGYQFFLAKSKTKFTWKSLMQPHFDFSLIYCSNTNEQRFHVASLTWWSRDLFRLPENSFRRFFDVCSMAEISAMLSHEKKPQPSSLRHTDNPEEPIFLSLGRLGFEDDAASGARPVCLFAATEQHETRAAP